MAITSFPSGRDRVTIPLFPEADLVARWTTSVRTLQRMRARSEGPAWFRIGRGIFYRVEDILAFEADAAKRGKP